MKHDFCLAKIYNRVSNTSISLIIVAFDGSVPPSHATICWVLAIKHPGRTLLWCSGPTYGACMDSFCSEAYGVITVSLHVAVSHLPPFGATTYQKPKPWTNSAPTMSDRSIVINLPSLIGTQLSTGFTYIKIHEGRHYVDPTAKNDKLVCWRALLTVVSSSLASILEDTPFAKPFNEEFIWQQQEILLLIQSQQQQHLSQARLHRQQHRSKTSQLEQVRTTFHCRTIGYKSRGSAG
jgi:hypothetical protein